MLSRKSPFQGILLQMLCLVLVLTTGAPMAFAAEPAKAGDKAKITTLRAAVKAGELTFKLHGDGTTTATVQLEMTNKSPRVLKVIVPANETFLSHSPLAQNMMATRDQLVTINPGAKIAATIATMCVSTKTVKPPPAEGIDYEVGSYPDKSMWKQLAAIVAASQELNKSGAYDQTMFARERREGIISQLAVWKLLGDKSDKPEDKITPAIIAKDTFDQLGKKPEDLKPEQKEKFDKAFDQIFLAVDLTLKRSSDPNLRGVCSLPSDSTFDTCYDVGRRASDKGDYTEAGELLQSAVSEAQSYGEKDPRLANSLTALADCYLNQGSPQEAEGVFKRALSVCEKAFGPEYLETAQALLGLAISERLQNKPKDAEPPAQRALAIREKSLGADNSLTGDTVKEMASVYMQGEKFEEAEPLLKRAMAIRYKSYGAESPETAEIHKSTGDLYNKQGKYPQAEKLYMRALAIDQKVLGAEHPYVSTILDGLAEALKGQNKDGAAEPYATRSGTIKEKTLGANANLLAAIPDNYQAMERIASYSSALNKMDASVREVQLADAKDAAAAGNAVNRPVKDKWALVIGISKFEDPTINLKYAAKDAQDFYDYLVHQGGFAQDHVRLLTDEKATRENIMSEIGDRWLPRVAAPDDLVLIYISSHGSPSKADVRGTNYLVAHNTRKDELYATGLAMNELSKMVKERVHSDRVVLVLDACHSGAASPVGKGMYRQANFDADQVVQGTGQLVICSSEPSQTSWESNKYPNGVFTHYLIEGLKKNGSTTALGDAYQFMKTQVQEEVLHDRGELQTPVLKSRWQGSDLRLAAPVSDPRPGLQQN